MKSIIKSMTVVLLCIVVCAAIPATSTLGKAENVIEHINEHRQDKTRQDKTRQDKTRQDKTTLLSKR